MLEDIYFQDDYINLYLNGESTLFNYTFEDAGEVFLNKTIKREVHSVGKINITNPCFDLESAYGYGGYRTNSQDQNFVQQAFQAYSHHCRQSDIVAEFIRFLPFNDFTDRFPSFFDFLVHDRDTVYVDLTKTKEERWAQYDANTRNMLRKAEKILKVEETRDPNSFIDMYYETMMRNNANEFYFFESTYFKNLIALKDCRLYNVLLDGEVICSSFVLNGTDVAHYHLSANRTEYMKFNGNYFLLDHAFEEARKEQKKYFFLGGGRSNQANDSLLLFKKKFSKHTLPFYIAGKVFLSDEYKYLCQQWTQQANRQQSYFLKYRLDL